ncbi:DoxX family membrane protein [Mucilaginibacter sp. 22184]|uniref:DoxX family membrane protein n=1 Tax=Mucilaginibacter sp. 22184 TaxID=3453887 RepID=UPI003F849AA9
MNNTAKTPQLFLRLALGIGFILPVLDRLGALGDAGVNGNAWGNWANFVTYTNTLLPFLGKPAAGIMALLATIAEALFAVLLIIGYKTRLTALGSFALTLTFALSMAIFVGPRIPFNYSVFADSAAALLLSTIPVYHWSLDHYLKK